MTAIPRKSASGFRPVTSRRGAVLAMAIWVILILSALVMIYARSMRVELTAAGNRVAAEQADAVERAAEQFVVARVDAAKGDAGEVTSAPAEAVQVGDGFFWIMRPRVGDPGNVEFGIVDEASKININVTELEQLALLPGVTHNVAAAIHDWIDDDKEVTDGGAETDYYIALPNPYRCKDGPLETIEELKLVKGVDDNLLYGEDRNHNGAADDVWPADAQRTSAALQGANADRRGLAPFITVSSVERNTDAKKNQRVNVTKSGGGGGGQPAPGQPGGTLQTTPTPAKDQAAQLARPARGGGGVVATPSQPRTPAQPGKGNPNANEDSALQNAMTDALGNVRAGQIVALATSKRPYTNVLDFAKKGNMTADELNQVFDKLSASDDKAIIGRVNVNTAPREVLLCLPGLEDGDASQIVNNRPMHAKGACGWILDTLEPDKIAKCGGLMTGSSAIYSADIVATSNDGRAFKRVKVIVDGRQSPPVIVRRVDLTSLGWPLTDSQRQDLRAGRPPQVAYRDVNQQGIEPSH